jgi:hypothetical protein
MKKETGSYQNVAIFNTEECLRHFCGRTQFYGHVDGTFILGWQSEEEEAFALDSQELATLRYLMFAICARTELLGEECPDELMINNLKRLFALGKEPLRIERSIGREERPFINGKEERLWNVWDIVDLLDGTK